MDWLTKTFVNIKSWNRDLCPLPEPNPDTGKLPVPIIIVDEVQVGV